MRRILAGVALSVLAGSSAFAGAFDNNPAFSRDPGNPWFFGIAGGAIVPGNLTATGTVNLGLPITVKADTRFETGFAADGVLGYQINQYLALEGQVGAATFDIKSFNMSVRVLGQSASVKLAADGDVDIYTGFVNAIVTPVGIGRVTPYFGGGIGAANMQTRLNSLSAGDFIIPVGTSDSETDLAAQAIVGVDVKVNPALSFGARYSFMWIDIGESNTFSACTCGLLSGKEKVNDFTASVVAVTARMDF